MTDKELRSLNRAELLELLIKISKENEELRAKAAELETRLGDRRIAEENAGSLAEAALSLNAVFSAADAAAAQYLENIKIREAEIEALQRETEQKSAVLLSDAQNKADEIVAKAKRESDAYWENVSVRLESICADYADLKNLLGIIPRNKE